MDFSAVLREPEPELEAQTPAITPKRVPWNLEDARSAFEPFKVKLEEVKGKADALSVQDDPSAQAATALAGQVKKLGKAIDDKRKTIVEEPNGFVKSVNSLAKMFTDPLGQIERTLKGKIGSFQTERELQRRKQEEALRQAQAELYRKQQAEAKAAHVDPPPPPVPIPLKPETVTRSDTGASAHVRKVWKAEILDPQAVPRHYCEPSMKLINDALKMGVRQIDGCRIFEDIQTILRT